MQREAMQMGRRSNIVRSENTELLVPSIEQIRRLVYRHHQQSEQSAAGVLEHLRASEQSEQAQQERRDERSRLLGQQPQNVNAENVMTLPILTPRIGTQEHNQAYPLISQAIDAARILVQNRVNDRDNGDDGVGTGMDASLARRDDDDRE
jgi:hypothetical protein